MPKKLNLLLLALITLVLFAWVQRPQPELKLVFCDVGQGDAVLAIYRDQQLLVDGGPNNGVLSCLGRHLPFWDREIELVIASHNEADHITGLVEVVRRYRVGRVIASSQANETAEWLALKQALDKNQVKVNELEAGSLVNFGPVQLRWLWPDASGPKVLGAGTSLNRFSQVIWARFGEFDWLLPGDIDTKIEKQLAGAGLLPDVEVLKVAHHGSKYSSGDSFLKAVAPELAVIEVGKNSFGHPTAEVLARLEQVKAKIKRTDNDGDVVITSDGRSWRVLE